MRPDMWRLVFASVLCARSGDEGGGGGGCDQPCGAILHHEQLYEHTEIYSLRARHARLDEQQQQPYIQKRSKDDAYWSINERGSS